MSQIITCVVLPGKPGGRSLSVDVVLNGNFLELRPHGYGEPDAAVGAGSPVVLDWCEGKLQVLVNPDILDVTQAQLIDLELAREIRLPPE